MKTVIEQPIRDEQQMRKPSGKVDAHPEKKTRQPERGSELHLEIARQTGNQILARELMCLNWIIATFHPMPPFGIGCWCCDLDGKARHRR